MDDAAPPTTREITGAQFREATTNITNAIGRVIDGKPDAIRAALICLLAEGHLLIEDVPGVGKTMLARALAASTQASVKRIQFTPDLLPSDITGVSIYNPQQQEFVFKPGAVFANIVIADEVNRASPKTQSALLEAMEERRVSADGYTHELDRPFFVVATQNPMEMEGTYALPEAQRDRFMMRISMGYPDFAAERAMVRDRDTTNPIDALRPVVSARGVQLLTTYARSIHVSPLVEEYAVRLAQATRVHPAIRLGASPRATLQLLRAAKVRAALEGRDFVLPDDVSSLVPLVFGHRVMPRRAATGDAEAVASQALADIVGQVEIPLAVSK